MNRPAARLAEAHLWLLLEEAIVAIRRGGAQVEEVRRNFRAVGQALAGAGVVNESVSRHLVGELEDVLAVRGLVPVSAFRAAPPPPPGEPRGAPRDAVAVWLEAEIERHLDLVAGFAPEQHPGAGADALRILSGPVRAFEAAGVLGPAKSLIAELEAALVDAGYDAGRKPASALTGHERTRPQWAAFLRRRPHPLPDHFEPQQTRDPRALIGEIDGRTLRVTRISWTADVLEVVAAIRSPRIDPADVYRTWACRAVNDRGGLHLGQPVAQRHQAGAAARFLLRPGLLSESVRLDLRITCGGQRVDTAVAL